MNKFLPYRLFIYASLLLMSISLVGCEAESRKALKEYKDEGLSDAGYVSVTPTNTMTPTNTPIPTDTPTPTNTSTPTNTPTPTDTPTPTNTSTPTPNPQYAVYTMRINTDGGKEITSKEEYVTAVMNLDGEEYTLKIKGRGNSSWGSVPKKSYRLKLDEKSKLLGMKGDKDWSLAGNYPDPSQIRNPLVFDIAKVADRLEWNPDYRFVEFYLNDVYMGIYLLQEKIEEGKNKVDIGGTSYDSNGKVADTGLLIEFGIDYSSPNRYGEDYFLTDNEIKLYIKEPENTGKWNPIITYANDYVYNMQRSFEKGNYEEYIDVDSWVDWFLVNELAFSTENVFFRSLYMYKKEGGKMYLGPLWDYDMAFGNYTRDLKNYNGWVSVDSTYIYVQDSYWMRNLLSHPEFEDAVKKRWAEIKDDLLKAGLESIDRNSEILKEAQVRNFDKWPKVFDGIGYAKSTLKGIKTYEGQIDYLRDFLNSRWKWMDEHLTREGSICD